jgi:hypothetical protein
MSRVHPLTAGFKEMVVYAVNPSRPNIWWIAACPFPARQGAGHRQGALFKRQRPAHCALIKCTVTVIPKHHPRRTRQQRTGLVDHF